MRALKKKGTATKTKLLDGKLSEKEQDRQIGKMDGKSRRHLTVLEHLALVVCQGGSAGENAGGLKMMSAIGVPV